MAHGLTAVLLFRSYSMPGLSYNSILGKFMVFTTDAEVSAWTRPLKYCGWYLLYRQPLQTWAIDLSQLLMQKAQHSCMLLRLLLMSQLMQEDIACGVSTNTAATCAAHPGDSCGDRLVPHRR